MVATTINVLITGCNRGIGKGLLTTYLSRPSHVVVGAVRDIDSLSSAALHDLPKGHDSRLILLKLDSTSTTDASELVEDLQITHEIKHLDIVIANAGISNYFGKARITPAAEMLSHYTINTLAPLLLFQATAPLLDHGCNPKFVAISSGAGSISGMDELKVENTAYGASKCALNFVIRKIHMENESIVAFPINPGWLRTDLGNHAAVGAGMEQAPAPVEDGIKALVDQIDRATRELTSGRFMSAQDGDTALPW
ncbi:related to ketoreductase [Rhynchosporium agropyri]|uniref:Related to ketoreductase n=1 Tax=Rhynchosporium agropyri TaxID=914238 RepID=A0A1E1L4W1_9HELO|nr:related to ketoreductase [Rhynchosporium agropyri]